MCVCCRAGMRLSRCVQTVLHGHQCKVCCNTLCACMVVASVHDSSGSSLTACCWWVGMTAGWCASVGKIGNSAVNSQLATLQCSTAQLEYASAGYQLCAADARICKEMGCALNCLYAALFVAAGGPCCVLPFGL